MMAEFANTQDTTSQNTLAKKIPQNHAYNRKLCYNSKIASKY